MADLVEIVGIESVLDIQVGPRNARCRKCGRPFEPSKLLYPIENKDYTADPLLVGYWRGIQAAMNEACLFTPFGYSAQDTDVEAMRLLQEGWGDPGKRQLEEVEIIDNQGPRGTSGSLEPLYP